MPDVRRRQFITLLGGAAAAWPLAARAQQTAKAPRIGFLRFGLASANAGRVEALRAGLRELGYVEGKTIVIEFGWAETVDQLHERAAELVRMNVDVIFAMSSTETNAGAPHLTLSVTPVMVGAGLAWAVEGKVHWLAVLAALVGSVFQLGTNIHNDAADFERGGDGCDRIGPPRVTASGLLTATTVKRGAIVCFAIAALMGVYLVFVGGWPILILGVLCIASGWGYTGGPFPIAYTPFGELFVVAFFGVGAVSVGREIGALAYLRYPCHMLTNRVAIWYV